MNLLSVGDLGPDQLAGVIDLAARVKADPGSVADTLKGRSIGLFFMKQSVRTWVSCDVAAMELGLHSVSIRNEEVGLGKREPPEDVGRVLERYLDLLALRVFDHTDLTRLAGQVRIPVVNLLSDREHPCQAIGDLQTIAERRPLRGTVLTYVGDGNNVANSLVLAAAMAGIEVRVASPPGYEPMPEALAMAAEHGPVSVTSDPRQAVAGADVVYTDVWTSMGQEDEALDRQRAFAGFQVDTELFELASADAFFMHCLPAHRGEEVTADMLEHPRSVVFDQAENRKHSFKAILLHLLG
ncbi:MAG TPA: ornithine carbamoyltransferase [Acidimicrobiia bacterium]|jgi:ornithine carbamoyltransferase